MSTDPITCDQLSEALRAAIASVLARLTLKPDGTPLADGTPPVVLHGSLTGLLMHDGQPETATGFDLSIGHGPPAGWSTKDVVAAGATAGQSLWKLRGT